MMTVDEFTALRQSLGLRQRDFAAALGISLRSLQEVEHGDRPMRLYISLAAERVALTVAIERGQPMLAPSTIRRDAMRIVHDMQT